MKKLNVLKKFQQIKKAKNLLIKIKWVLSQSKPAIPFLIFTIIINSSLSLINVYNASVVSKSLIDSAIDKNISQVIKWLIIMATIMFGQMLISPITTFLSTHASTKLSQDMQKRLYKHITYSDWLEQSKFHSISLLTRVTSDVQTISSTVLSTIPSLISILVTLIASFSTLLFLAPSIALISVFIGPILLIISKLFGKKLKKLYKEIQEEDVKYKSFMQETIQNIMIVKTFCMEKLNITKLEEIQKNKYNLAMKNTKLSVLTGISMGFCSSLAYFIIFCFGALNIANGVGTYGTFTAMLQLYSNIQGPFSALAGVFPTLIGAIAASERLMELEEMSLESNILDKDNLYIQNIKYKDISNLKTPSIEFTGVSFGYKKNSPILKDINLNIKPGETIAFVGPSGEGKTTIIRLLLALINSDSGSINIKEDNVTSSLDRNHRELISYVPQGNTLFSGTIEDNLHYGNITATSNEIEKALKSAYALNFIEELADGIKTLVGERGHGISEGQAQRIAIARAFLRKRPILILDEATSALDPETEVNVLKEIKELPHNPTCIIITHRPSALNICSRIMKLEKGSIIEIDKDSILEVASELI